MDRLSQSGQRTATPTSPPAEPGARSVNEDGKTGLRPVLGVAEEAPRPLPGADAAGGHLAELVADLALTVRHQVEEGAGVQPERRPVEVVVRDQAGVFVPTWAREGDREHRGMGGAGQPLQAAERR